MTEFAAELRRLRAGAGAPPYRALARAAHYSPSTLADAAGGRRLPSLPVTLAYVGACGGDVAEWERRWRAVSAELAAGPPTAEEGERAPYPGLAAFQAADAEWFCGRDALVDELHAKVGARPFVAVFGPSGTGKSSLLRAGLVPRVTAAGGVPVVFTPGVDPMGECVARLARVLGTRPDDVRAALAAGRVAPAGSDEDVVLVVDQFEELFTLCPDPATRSAFVHALLSAARGRCRVVVGVRADFYQHCLLEPELAEALCDAQVNVGPMTAEQLYAAIVHPARRAGCAVEAALVTTLVAEAHGKVGVLPLLSHALLETWRRRRGNTLTLTGFRRTGGIDGALAKSAESVYGALDGPGRAAVRGLLLRLVALGDQDTARRVERAELAGAETVLAELAAARLVVLSDEHVEISHEALIGAWPRLRDWLAEDREGQRLHRSLTLAAAAWRQHDRDPDLLLRGTPLAAAVEWSGRARDVNHAEREFLDACLVARRGQRRRARLVRALVALVAGLLVVTASAVIYAARTTVPPRHRASMALDVTTAADALTATDPAPAARLLLAAHRLNPSDATADRLVVASGLVDRVPLGGETRSRPVLARGGGLAAVSEPATDTTSIRVLADGRATPAATVPGGRLPAHFSADRRLLITHDAEQRLRLTDIGDPSRVRALSTVDGPFSAAWTTPDGDLLIAVDTAGVARLLDISDPAHPRPRGALPDVSTVLALSPDGKLLVTLNLRMAPGAPYDEDLEVWDISSSASPRLLGRVASFGAPFSSAAFVGDGRLLTGDLNGGVTLWDLTDVAAPRVLGLLPVHRGGVAAVAVSGDRKAAVTAGTTGDLVLWELPDSRELHRRAVVPHSGAAVTELGFAPDDLSVVAVGGGDHVHAVRWQLDPARAAAVICAADGPPLTPEVWARYLPDVPYQQPC
ncbi:nSTAND1 domain-containing NTPase [Saccharothrix obliqua]|uniref:nSTAND1 domain-containing NTPase n=1 Tax=Saccharothrix obliqua TaxID=2861747 RepID=UPI001C5F6EF5|nr:XRE family transcriptional regulator [Saccharothrix obliqua]MBW4722054.1 XRE family transcriptional regulator [Saccharothrix obliqua]